VLALHLLLGLLILLLLHLLLLVPLLHLFAPSPQHERCVLLLPVFGCRVCQNLSVFVLHACPPASSRCPTPPLAARVGEGPSHCSLYRCFNSENSK
jgi:hypothetical protein